MKPLCTGSTSASMQLFVFMACVVSRPSAFAMTNILERREAFQLSEREVELPAVLLCKFLSGKSIPIEWLLATVK